MCHLILTHVEKIWEITKIGVTWPFQSPKSFLSHWHGIRIFTYLTLDDPIFPLSELDNLQCKNLIWIICKAHHVLAKHCICQYWYILDFMLGASKAEGSEGTSPIKLLLEQVLRIWEMSQRLSRVYLFGWFAILWGCIITEFSEQYTFTRFSCLKMLLKFKEFSSIK